MVTLTADASLPEALRQLEEPAEIRDTAGTLIGYFTPAAQEDAFYREARAHFDPEETRRRRESGAEGYTTAEVLEHLNSLDRD